MQTFSHDSTVSFIDRPANGINLNEVINGLLGSLHSLALSNDELINLRNSSRVVLNRSHGNDNQDV